MTHTLSSPFHLLVCRPGAEPFLLQELRDRHGIASRMAEPGLVQVIDNRLPEKACIFERQRMPSAHFCRLQPGEPLPDELIHFVWNTWKEDPMPWCEHQFPADDTENLSARLSGISRELIRKGCTLNPGLMKWNRKAEKLIAKQNGMILQLCLSSAGLYVSVSATSDISSPQPGGMYRMRMDPAAPSRSYLKVEEAFVRMGRYPRENETVIDLGSAPGGWSFAFAKRGCLVTSVDNGPLKINDACIRRIDHVHADGLTFQLSKHLPPVDWLVADMLIPPGKAFGVLKYWLSGGRCNHIVLNIKCPQQEPISALNPIMDWLETHHPSLDTRQLIHDRREVTVFGSVSS
jgi:23S rRNA (cytidine2498-2'-O)-methyltransferase